VPSSLDLAGVKFGRLTADRRVGKSGRNGVPWLCVCDCGKEAVAPVGSLRSGQVQSCGCLHRDAAKARGLRMRRDDVSYFAAHQRIYRTRGRAAAQVCQCGAPAQEWSYDHSDPREMHGTVDCGRGPACLTYSLDPQHYIAVCVPCHRTLDATHRIGASA